LSEPVSPHRSARRVEGSGSPSPASVRRTGEAFVYRERDTAEFGSGGTTDATKDAQGVGVINKRLREVSRNSTQPGRPGRVNEKVAKCQTL
jgi:hypothetical protein